MRSKDNILKQYTEEGLGSASDGALSMLTVLNVLEVLIDIRDILDNRLLEIDRDIDKILTILKEAK